MKIFLSWSGERSRAVALALRSWLPMILQSVEPWLADIDITAGERWSSEIGKQLEITQFGIICLTRENLSAPWVLFESGALSKSLSLGLVCPYLVDLDLADISGPLAQFQAKKAERDSTLQLVQAINARLAKPVEGSAVATLFEVLWPRLEQELKRLPTSAPKEGKSRSQAEILEDLVTAVRSLDHRFSRMEARLARLEKVKGHSVVRGGAQAAAIKVRIVAGHLSTPMIEDGDQFVVLTDGSRLIEQVALSLGLDSGDFNEDWFLRDPVKDRLLSEEDCLNIVSYFGDAKASLIVTSVPF